VNPATNAVLHFDVQLRNDIGLEGSVLLEILLGGSIDDVSNGKAFDSLILRTESSTVDANNGLDEASVIFVPAMISAFDDHVAN